jgi:hypothetical protein
MEGNIMAWTSDRTWIAIQSMLVTMLMLSWAYLQA